MFFSLEPDIYSIIKSCYFIDNNRCLPLLDSKYPSGIGISYDLFISSSKHCAWIFLSRWLKKCLFNELLNDWLGFILVLLGPYSHCSRSVCPWRLDTATAASCSLFPHGRARNELFESSLEHLVLRIQIVLLCPYVLNIFGLFHPILKSF